MFSLSRKWMIVVLVAWAIKIILIPLLPLTSDFYNWIGGTQQVFNFLGNGKLPSVATFGPYLGMYFLLTPFYWLWTLLPVQHMTLAEIAAHPSLAGYALIYLMKCPVLVSDFFTGLFVFNLAGGANNQKAGKALLSWHLNPFNWYYLYGFTLMDIIPTAIVLLAIQYGVNRKWSRCALCLSSATILRLYPLFLVPFFAVYVVWRAGRVATKPFMSFLTAFMTPLLLVVVFQWYVSGSLQTAINAFLNLPFQQSQLGDFFGFRLSTFFPLTPFLLVVQLYVALSRWKKDTVLALLILAPLLGFVASGIGFGIYLTWVSPLLSVYYALDGDLFLFCVTFVSAFSPLTLSDLFIRYFGWNLMYQGDQPVLDLLGPCVSGVHYGAKIIYLLKLNLSRLRGS